jgi:hypothetical protein
MFKYSYDSLVCLSSEPVDWRIARLARFGYDAINRTGDPDQKEIGTAAFLTKENLNAIRCKYVHLGFAFLEQNAWARQKGSGDGLRYH